MLAAADTIVAIQRDEAAILQRKLPGHEILVAPIAAVPVNGPQVGTAEIVMFVGSSAAPNVDGIKWFIESCWPKVQESRPNASLYIVGSVCYALGQMPETIKLLNVVESLEDLYEKASVIISPLRAGSGLKIKLIEALSKGKAVVATPITLQGVADILAGCARVTDSAPIFASQVIELLADEGKRAELGAKGISCVSQHFAPESAYGGIAAVLERTGSGKLIEFVHLNRKPRDPRSVTSRWQICEWWSSPVRKRAICKLSLLAMVALVIQAPVAYSANMGEERGEVLSSKERGHVFDICKGHGGKIIKGLNGSLGQKIRLIGFGSMSLDQLRTELKTNGTDALLDLNDGQQLRIVGVGSEVISSIEIQLDRSNLIPTFIDEFEVLSLSSDKDPAQSKGTWRTDFGLAGVDGRTLVNNGELQVYVDRLFSGTASTSLNIDPFQIANGKLEIIARPLEEDQRRFSWERSYSSGLLTSKGSFFQKYGLFEIRAKMPKGRGLWPAFWLLPVSGQWPPEIDVLEILGDNPRKLYVSWHSNVGDKHSSETKAIDVPDTSEDFHTYSIYWTKDTIEWFFDDVQIASKPTPQDFHQPMYMLVNLAVGGTWPGAPDNSTQFPAKYTIDWIRAYASRDEK